MESYQFDSIGLAHFSFAILSMILGALIIFIKKGGSFHKKLGYVYFGSMIGLNVTALMIYKLFGFFGPFHVFALISLVSVIAGFVPAYLKKPKDTWLEYHYEFMNWSVVGLYAAFWSETFTRFFSFQGWDGFWILVGTATGITVAIGAYLIKKKKSYFLEKFGGKKYASVD
ncbi:DUF2306 domain-containing protein [Gracilimonas sediminicola]|uniref:DUF2306 domain-containing protein n=1 Tax=Gracilimonas sediminicola TaxID=2952158 RepID=A0A9X2L1F8_9BACT|nr:DUF2306 domain-containing protein [Gracilimonas sediminicola]MCP9290467.1 DUF2306 domain-containing protein [Gracilimonas sediminicola]